MQVILLEKIHNLGGIGSVVTVKDGYGRNFLLPRQKALRATKHNLEVFALKRAEIEQENEVKKQQAESAVEQIAGITLVLYRQAGEDGRLYGSVSARDIAEAISNVSDIKVNVSQIELGSKFKELGDYMVSLTLHPEVTTKIAVHIARGDLAAAEAETLSSLAEEKQQTQQ